MLLQQQPGNNRCIRRKKPLTVSKIFKRNTLWKTCNYIVKLFWRQKKSMAKSKTNAKPRNFVEKTRAFLKFLKVTRPSGRKRFKKRNIRLNVILWGAVWPPFWFGKSKRSDGMSQLSVPLFLMSFDSLNFNGYHSLPRQNKSHHLRQNSTLLLKVYHSSIILLVVYLKKPWNGCGQP